MGIIEHYTNQNLTDLRDKVIFIFDKLCKADICKCSSCLSKRSFDKTNWHPEKYGNYNDTWKLVEFMEGFGYSTYNYDTVLYTFEFRDYDKTFIVKGDGLNFNQAVCNCFVELGLKILFKY